MASRCSFAASFVVAASARMREQTTAECTEKVPVATVTSHGVTSRSVLDDDFTSRALRGVVASKQALVRTQSPPPPPDETHTFVIIGDGVASRAAAQTIKTFAPQNTSLLVLNESSSPSSSPSSPPQIGKAAAQSIDSERSVVVLSDGTTVGFERCLLACGNRHEPLPANASDFVDEAARPLVSALHSTQDRAALLQAARRGHPVCVVGGSWYAVELAAAAADEAKLHGLKVPKVTLVCPESAPLVRTLPRFLATSVAQRLASRGVAVKPYSVVRYISPSHLTAVAAATRTHANPSNSGDSGNTQQATSSSSSSSGGSDGDDEKEEDKENAQQFASMCDVYTCKTFDSLDSERTPAAVVAIADYVSSSPGAGTQGLFLPASALSSSSSSSSLEQHAELGGVVVNAELQASSRVFACGDVAVFPHVGQLGRCRGAGVDHALHSGVAAARNMLAAQLTPTAHPPPPSSSSFRSEPWSAAARATPLITSLPYTHAPVFACESASLGLALGLCGRCDGAAETHSFFWHNDSSSSASSTSSSTGSGTDSSSFNESTQNGGTDNGTNSGKGPSYFSPFYGRLGLKSAESSTPPSPSSAPLSLTRAQVRRRDDDGAAAQKLHGSGVVFYMDAGGERVVGVALWCTPGLSSKTFYNEQTATQQRRKSSSKRKNYEKQKDVASSSSAAAAAAAAGAAAAGKEEGGDKEESTKGYAESLSIVRDLLVRSSGSPKEAAALTASRTASSSSSSSSGDGGGGGEGEGEGAGNSGKGGTSELERWYRLNPAEKERLRHQLERRKRVEALRSLAGSIMATGKGGNDGGDGRGDDDNEGGLAKGAYSSPSSSSSSSSAPSSSPPPLLSKGTYRHVPTKTPKFIGEVGGAGGAAGSEASGTMGGAGVAGRAGLKDQSAWAHSATVGEFPFTTGRHGRSRAAQRSEAYTAGLVGDSSSEAGAWAQRLTFHPDARS